MIDGELHMILGEGPAELMRWRVEDLSQTLEIDAPPQAFSEQQIEVARSATQVTLPSTFGLYANYDVQWQKRLSGDGNVDGVTELGVLTPRGDLNHQQLYRSGMGGGWVRLDSRWTIDRPEHLTSWRLGDSIAQPGTWGQAMRFGGVQWSTDFSLRPGFLSFPCPRCAARRRCRRRWTSSSTTASGCKGACNRARSTSAICRWSPARGDPHRGAGPARPRADRRAAVLHQPLAAEAGAVGLQRRGRLAAAELRHRQQPLRSRRAGRHLAQRPHAGFHAGMAG
ncbi:hypothetical protein ACQ859_28075 [Roseateles chitinivorans]|uniref:hypothetical protein n=1 Tax=Roseateles chitinivorans TaxID=2917965 RepID=UPI003D66E78B